MIVLFLVTATATAAALPSLGAPLPAVEIADVAAGSRRLLPDRHPILVMLEDKEAQHQNDRARVVLGHINDSAANRARFEFVAVADVDRWNWWPARRYVLDDLKAIAEREHTRLFADWSGALRKAWRLSAHKSVLLLVGADGKLRFASEGTVSDEQLAALVAELKALGCAVD